MAPRSIKEAHLRCTDASCQGKANQDAGTEGRSLCLGQASQPLRTMTLFIGTQGRIQQRMGLTLNLTCML